MTLSEGFRVWFLVLYILNILGFLVAAIRFRVHREAIEKQTGPLPSPGIVIPLGIPLLILLIRVGEIQAEWLPLRLIGLGLSLYNAVLVPWAMQTLGHYLVPGAAVFRDHTLITSGPFRFVRHPIYSAGLALLLGAALGTLNWLLLVFWFVAVAGSPMAVRMEEGLLQSKFGPAYEAYAQQTGRFIPRLR